MPEPAADATPATPATPAPPRAAARAGRPRRRAVALLCLVGAAIGGVVIGAAHLLDQPLASTAPDASQPIVAGPVVAPGEELTGGPQDLPPLSLVLDRPLPASLARQGVARQVQVLEAQVRATGSAPSPALLTQLGSAYQRAGEQSQAASVYSAALAARPGYLPALAGLALVKGSSGTDGLEEAHRDLAALRRDNPRSQLVAFNQGWLDVYRRDGKGAVDAWRRTIQLGPSTPLGTTARTLLVTIARQQGGVRP